MIYLKKIIQILLRKLWDAHLSFSQTGEDRLILRALFKMGITSGTYLDIGANDPIKLNNTYLLYLNGFHGVLVEPMPLLADKLYKKRSKDIVLHAGIGVGNLKEAILYIMSNPYFHTFNKDEAEKIQMTGQSSIIDSVKVPLFSINDVVEKYFDSCPNFISIDAESMDEEIVRSFDFTKYSPEIFCVESVDFSGYLTDSTNDGISTYLQEKGYIQYADMNINRIFIHKQKWINRNKKRSLYSLGIHSSLKKRQGK